MKGENPFSKWLKKWTNQDDQAGNEGKNKKPSLYVYMLIVLVLGVAIMMGSEMLTKRINIASSADALPAVAGAEPENVETFGSKNNKADVTIADYERSFETQIKEALENIAGVKDVKVVVNVDATEKKIYMRNHVAKQQITEEIDREGGKRKVDDTSKDEQMVILKNGDKEVPLVQETKKPAIRGVLIVAKGAENITVKKWIVEAVTRALDVPSYRVAVMPKK
ncbi:stage III sporulation protein AG [Bacillus testis]|uniref:stage III sporulation protein AG n=1 Tax=Bacillus testis TaxID=1622072 RepID=UPI00067F5891|nr:stage III sporulation protein AG [Bacillus testis]